MEPESGSPAPEFQLDDQLAPAGTSGSSSTTWTSRRSCRPSSIGAIPSACGCARCGRSDDHRSVWALLMRLWEQTVDRAARLPEPSRHERVDGEWSVTETLRHLVFATDCWAGRMIMERSAPYHPLGLVPTDFEPADAVAAGLDPAAQPSFEEVLAVRAERVGSSGTCSTPSPTRSWTGSARAPWPGDPDHPRPVRECLRVIMHEECEHRRFAERDLAVLEAR